MSKVKVWDLKMYQVDEQGEPITDKEGNVIVYDTVADLSCLDFITEDELIEAVDCEQM